MYERRYGSKYKELGGYQPAAHIAKLMRADIKAELAAGNLPGAMSNYSVRIHNYSGGRAIYIEARDLDGMREECDGTKLGSKTELDGGGYIATACRNHWCKGHPEMKDNPHAETHDRLTFEGERVLEILQKIHSAYNYDGSEVMVDYFDVNYYGNASIEDEWRRRSRLRDKERKAAKKAKSAA